jgi:ATP-dependent exoDNAse (exonuclease V) beta subunit
VLGIAADHVGPAAAIVERLLTHELLRRARAADAVGACRRETPITYVMQNGTVVEGIVDLAFEENDSWTVVDYKTDVEVAADGEERYRGQVAFYADAIARATGQPARAILMRL